MTAKIEGVIVKVHKRSKTDGHRLTLPKAFYELLGKPRYMFAYVKDGKLIYEPVTLEVP